MKVLKYIHCGLLAFFVAASNAALCATPATAPIPPALQTKDGERVFANAKAAVLQIRMQSIGSDSQNSTGSGFLVSADGLVITNYHVIARLITEPGRYHLSFVTATGETGELQLLAVDVPHDLALLSRSGSNLPFLEFDTTPMTRGDTGYSIGNPRNVGMTITEGMYNGLRDKSLYDQIHFSGAINPGMSGGPAIRRDGRVFGINVATMTASQLMGFLVPAQYATALIARRPPSVPTVRELLEEVARQSKAHGTLALESLGGSEIKSITAGGFRLPYSFGKTSTCGNAPPKEDGRRYTTDFHMCRSDSAISPTDELTTGTMQAYFSIYDQKNLDVFQFSKLRQWGIAPDNDKSFPYADLSRYSCRTSFVDNAGTLLRVMLCARAYKRLTGLHDLVVWIKTETGHRREVNIDMVLRGVPFDQGMQFVRDFIGGIKWVG